MLGSWRSLDVFDRFTGGLEVMSRVLMRALAVALWLGASWPGIAASPAAAQADPDDDAPSQDASSRDGLLYRVERLEAERDALSRGNPTYVVGAAAEPCLILRAAPGAKRSTASSRACS